MRIVALIDEREVIERILRHLGLWEEGVRRNPARAPPDVESIVELFAGDPLPDHTPDTVMDYDLCAIAGEFATGGGLFKTGRFLSICPPFLPIRGMPRMGRTPTLTKPPLSATLLPINPLFKTIFRGACPNRLKSDLLSAIKKKE